MLDAGLLLLHRVVLHAVRSANTHSNRQRSAEAEPGAESVGEAEPGEAGCMGEEEGLRPANEACPAVS